ncbi:MAG: hypothetical protein ACRYGP_26725 [Janthinobacterium lividum]
MHDFETEQAARKEDRIRARNIRRVLNPIGPTGWLNIKDRLWLNRQGVTHLSNPNINRDVASGFVQKLEHNYLNFNPQATLASSVTMRAVRKAALQAMHQALKPYPALCAVTVINQSWRLTPADLERLTAATIKRQFTTHLNRCGAARLPGPLIAFLHGEFEPTSGYYQLHFHIITTPEKAHALRALRRISGYVKTATGAAPIHITPVRDRERQFSYVLKGYWPSKAVRTYGTVLKRDRSHHRIPEPFATQVLLWLDRQHLADLTILNGVWSRRNGGPAAMRALYLLIQQWERL